VAAIRKDPAKYADIKPVYVKPNIWKKRPAGEINMEYNELALSGLNGHN